jgi:transcriptional regulator with XRE-family HTH domain
MSIQRNNYAVYFLCTTFFAIIPNKIFTTTLTMNTGAAIRTIRKQLSISQQDLAAKCSISQPALSRIESGTKMPTPRSINKICKILDIPESLIYIIAMQENDVHESKKGVYRILYPSIKDLALQIACTNEPKLKKKHN